MFDEMKWSSGVVSRISEDELVDFCGSECVHEIPSDSYSREIITGTDVKFEFVYLDEDAIRAEFGLTTVDDVVLARAGRIL